VTSFLYNAGQSTFDSFFPLLLSKKLAMAPTQIGALLTALSAVSFTVSATLFAPTQKFFGLTKTTVIGLTLVAVGLVCIGQANPAAVPPAAFLYVSGLPLFTPAVPILLMQCVPPTRRGTVMGVDSAINAIARIISPIVFGRVFAKDPALAFAGAGAVVFAAAALVVARRAIVLGANATARAFSGSR
jgi:MFS family permease